MTIRFQVGGITTSIPGTYDELRVASSLPDVAPAGRSVMIMGEAAEGVPGSDLDLRLNFYTNFDDVKNFYGSGPIVDAARMTFSSQPANVFSGSVRRLYVYKTNESTRAYREISAPSGYGNLVSATYGESGNLVKTQIVDAQSETLPSLAFNYLPTPAARSLRVMVSGVQHSAIAIAADARASAVVTALAGLVGATASGGDDKTDATDAMVITMTQAYDTLTITKDSGTGVFDDSSVAVGDSAYIPVASGLAGASDENVGAYIVTAVSSTTLSLKQVKKADATAEVNAVAMDTTITAYAVGDVQINGLVDITVDGTTATGTGASLEILEDSADKLGLGLLTQEASFADVLQNSTSTIANITASVPSAGKLRLDLDIGSWSTTPKAGDLVRIPRGSLIAGATDKNVGMLVVDSASSQNMTLTHLHAGMTTEAVAQVALSGLNGTLQAAASKISTDTAARLTKSSAERKVRIEASRESDGASLADNSIGGTVVMEIGYFLAGATAATATIDSQRKLTITPTGAGSIIEVNLKKYKSLQELAIFLNTRPGLSVEIPSAHRSSSTDVLDAVQAVDILDGQALQARAGRIKKDYNEFKTWFDDNFTLLAFEAGSLSILSGLPDAEANPEFLDNGVVGATNNASIQNGLDAALKVDVRQVVPLFSRDASKDILDGLTDTGSSYVIDAVLAATKAHVSIASSALVQRERFGVLSHYGSFEDSKEKARTVGFERCQMTFQLHNATDGDGNIERFLPWMSACAVAAGRSQAVLGTPMLRKPLLLSSAEHIGDLSLFSDSLVQDFDAEDRGQLEEAIEAGLLTLRAVSGAGIRVEGPDNTTRSKDNDPQAWVFERASVLFVLDEVRQTMRTTLDNFIGRRQSDAPEPVVKQVANNVLNAFLVGPGNGSLLAGRVNSVRRVGTKYDVKVELQPTEALEAIAIDVLASRTLV